MNAALSQTAWRGERVTQENWRRTIKDKVKKIDWKEAREDVRPFLEREGDLEIVTKQNCLKLLEDVP